VNEGQLLDLGGNGAPILGLFIDTGTHDTHTAKVDWGDGSGIQTPTVSEVAGSGAILGSHTYLNARTYTVKVIVTDDDGGVSDAQSFLVQVVPHPGLPPVVDPSAVQMSQIIAAGESVSLRGLKITDADSTLLSEVRVQLNPAGTSVLGALKIVGPLPGGIQASVDAAGTLTLTPTSGSTAALTDFQEALQQLIYQPTAGSAKPTATVMITVTATDDTGLPGSAQALVEFKTVENPEPPPVLFSAPPVVLSKVAAGSTLASLTISGVARLGLDTFSTSNGSGTVVTDSSDSESPEHVIAEERALQALLSSPHFARRQEVIDAVHSLGDIELVSLLGIDMGDEPVFAAKKKEAPQERVAAKPLDQPVVPAAAVPSGSGWKPLAFWSALAGGGTLWVGGTWWWNGRHRQRRDRGRRLR
jgi:PKD repeat protein